MNKDIIDAELLWKSAEHWLENFQLEDPFKANISSESCPCCQTYFNVWSNELPTCGGCPISISTGRTACRGTPYEDVHLLLHNSDKSKATAVILQDAIADEYEFLVSLAPSPKPNPYTLLEKGGEWLGATHEYLKWHATRGDSLTWGSYDPVHGLTVHDIELLAAKAIAADRAERKA